MTMPGAIAPASLATEAVTGTPVAVLDIGPKSVRLVVYDAAKRAPIPVFNEKVLCGLGRDLDSTGRLNPAGATLALASVRRFAALTQAMGVTDIDAFATAAVTGTLAIALKLLGRAAGIEEAEAQARAMWGGRDRKRMKTAA